LLEAIVDELLAAETPMIAWVGQREVEPVGGLAKCSCNPIHSQECAFKDSRSSQYCVAAAPRPLEAGTREADLKQVAYHDCLTIVRSFKGVIAQRIEAAIVRMANERALAQPLAAPDVTKLAEAVSRIEKWGTELQDPKNPKCDPVCGQHLLACAVLVREALQKLPGTVEGK